MSFSRFGALRPALLTLGAAELGVRLLKPRQEPIQPLPVQAADYFEAQEINRGARFTRPQLALGLSRQAIQLALLAWLSARAARRSTKAGGPSRAALAGACLAGASSAAAVPVAAVGRRRAVRAGLDTQSWAGWWLDLAKAGALSEALGAGAGAGALGLIQRYPRGWWVPAGAASVALTGVFGALAPVLLEPLFNDFTPLPAGRTRSDVLELARTAGVEVGEVYSVDASRRTSAANAYVSGLGLTKRVVLFDTLLDRYTDAEVRVVVAHELSHVRHRDVLRLLAFSAIVALPAARSVQRLSWEISPARSAPAAIPALALASVLVAAPLGLVAGRLSRAIERRADEDSLRLAGDPDAFISFQRAVALQNLADLEPPRWVRALLASHPATLERIGAAEAFRQAAGLRSGS